LIECKENFAATARGITPLADGIVGQRLTFRVAEGDTIRELAPPMACRGGVDAD
jgi:hypothetical protein